VGKREAFLIRVDPEVLDALRRWARDDLRSVNAQVEFILRRALMSEGRLGKAGKKRRKAEGSRLGKGEDS
jgi:hypothetical protein